MDYDEIAFPLPPSFRDPRFCFNITLNDDSLEEGTEQFSVNGGILVSLLSVDFIPGVTTVVILDDDLVVTDAPTTDAPTTEAPTTDAPTTDGATTTTDDSVFTIPPSTTEGMWTHMAVT